MRRSKSQRPILSKSRPAPRGIRCGAVLAQPLAGCFIPTINPRRHRPSAGLSRRAAPRRCRAASLVWWRGFRSKELTDLIEEALASNLDIAEAVARIVQADAQARVTGAALLPIVDLNASATRSRASQTPGGGGARAGGGWSERVTYSTSLNASYEIDFWGKNRAAAARRRRARGRKPLRSRSGGLSTVVSVANSYFRCSPRRIGFVSRATTSPRRRASSS